MMVLKCPSLNSTRRALPSFAWKSFFYPNQQQKKKFSSRKLMQRRKNGRKHYPKGFQNLLYIDFNINLVFEMTPNQQGRNHKRQSFYII
jgi:hypothetical protein